MLRVTLDAFSGHSNPSWSTEGDHVVASLRQLAQNRAHVSSSMPAGTGLGFRGTHIEIQDVGLMREHGLPARFVTALPHYAGGIGYEVTERLIQAAPLMPVPDPRMTLRSVDPVRDNLVALLRKPAPIQPTPVLVTPKPKLAMPPPKPPPPKPPASPPTPPGSPFTSCNFEVAAYDPGFWNDPAHKKLNNCYAYATNRRTDTFPQPGRATNNQATSMTADEVRAGALSDGAHDAGNCFADSFAPRYLVALVIAPNIDYHWYRWHGAFWGHKPGETEARNVDNSGKVITDPRTCDRGPYTVFAGFMLIPRTQRVA
jgi:hypothetical protein